MSFTKRISIEKFSASDGVLLYGLLALPERARKKAAVIHVHGMGSSFYSAMGVEDLSRAVTGIGLGFFSVQTRGSNVVESFGRVRGNKRTGLLAGTALERFEDCVYDIEGAVRFLASKGYRSIILSGHSTGCQKVLYYYSKRKSRKIKGLVLLAPSDDYNVGRVSLGKKFGVAVSEAKKASKRDRRGTMIWASKYVPPWMMLSAQRFLSTADPRRPESRILDYTERRMRYIAGISVPALAVFGTEDMYMEAAGLPADKAAKILRNNSERIETFVIKGADHGFHGKRMKLAKTVVEWVRKTV